MSEVVRVPLRNRAGVSAAYALVDAEDEQLVLGRRWSLAKRYVRTKIDRRDVYLHRLIARPADGYEVDHINRDTLDNRRANLRVVTHAQNLQNQPAVVGGTSRFRGVSWEAARRCWSVQVGVGGRLVRVGRFRTELEAAIAAEAFRREHMPFAQPDPELTTFDALERAT